MDPQSPSVVEVRGVHKAYAVGLWRRRTPALRGVTLQVQAGEVLGLIGPNRAGKTTLVKIILGLCRPDAGTVRRLGRPAADVSTLRQVGYVHEAMAFPRYLTAREVLDFYGAASLLPATYRRRRSRQLLDQFELSDRENEAIGRFSKGMLQRLALAQALLGEPRLLVLDEPAEGMDLVARRMTRAALNEHRSQGGATILVSHSLHEVSRVCDRVAILRNGELARCQSINDLVDPQHAHEDVEDALGPLLVGAAS